MYLFQFLSVFEKKHMALSRIFSLVTWGHIKLSWEIAAMLAKVVVVGVRRIVARGAQDLTNYAIL